VNIILVPYDEDVMVANFDASVGLCVGVDSYLHMASGSLLDSEVGMIHHSSISWHVHA
jgi:hypothetical protein